MISYNLYQGDCYEVLKQLSYNPQENRKYRIIITSPPYYKHRHYGEDSREIGQENSDEMFIERLSDIFSICRNLLMDDGSLWIVMGDTRRKYGKLMIPHRLALKLVLRG